MKHETPQALFKITLKLVIAVLQMGHLLVVFLTDSRHSWHRQRWLQGLIRVSDGVLKQIMHSAVSSPL
jgi:hypothetical protein